MVAKLTKLSGDYIKEHNYDVVKDTFLELLQEKDITKVTVMELCKKADINRATFYRYYDNVYDLLDKIEAEFVHELKESLEKIGKSDFNIKTFKGL